MSNISTGLMKEKNFKNLNSSSLTTSIQNSSSGSSLHSPKSGSNISISSLTSSSGTSYPSSNTLESVLSSTRSATLDLSTKTRVSNLQQEASKRAIRRVSELLTHPDHLMIHCENYDKSFQQKKQALEVKLKSQLQLQLEEARQSLALLGHSQGVIGGIRKNFVSIDELCQECQGLIEEYPLVRKVNTVRSNLLITRRELLKMLELPAKVKEIKILLEDNMNLLKVYSMIRDLEKMRQNAYYQARNYPDELVVLKEEYGVVDELSNALESQIWLLVQNCITLARRRPALLVQVVRIIEREERADASAVSPGTAGRALYQRVVKGYYKKCFSILLENIEKRFQEIFGDMLPIKDSSPTTSSTSNPSSIHDSSSGSTDESPNSSPPITPSSSTSNLNSEADSAQRKSIEKALSQAVELLDDLTQVRENVEPCFPPKYGIFHFYVTEYHSRFYSRFMYLSQQSAFLSPKEILDLVEWVSGKYDNHLQQLSAPEMRPPMIDALSNLTAAYQEHIKKLMKEWASRIITNDRKEKGELIDNRFYTDAPVNLFKFVDQQLSLAIGTKSERLILDVSKECAYVLNWFQKEYIKIFDDKEKKQELEFTYVMALINNNYKSQEYTFNLKDKIRKYVDDLLVNTIGLDEIADQFLKNAEKGIEPMVHLIFSDLLETIGKIFRKEWEEASPPLMGLIVATFEDYFSNDIQGFIPEEYFRKLVTDCLDKMINLYVQQLLSKKATFTPETTEEMMKKDEQLLETFFLKWTREKNVKPKITLLADLRELLVSPDPDMICLHFDSLIRSYPDITIKVVESLLNKRSDLNRSDVNIAIEGCLNILNAHTSSPSGKGENSVSNPIIGKEGFFSRLWSELTD